MDIDYLLWLQNFRGGFWDSFLLNATDFIASPVMYVFIAVLYWCINKKAAIFLAMNISFGSMINQTLKNVFCIYRPWIRDSRIAPLDEAKKSATGYSFPSGHTQIAASEFLSIAVWQKNRKCVVAICIFMTALIMFTRNYLGVHTPQDVIVSLIISCLVIFFNSKLIDWVDNKGNRDLFVFIAGVVITTITLIYLTVKPYPLNYDVNGILLVDPKEMITDCYTAAGCVYGFLIGWVLERRFIKFNTDGSKKALVIRGLIGSVILLIYALFLRKPLGSVHPYFGEMLFIAIAFIYILYLYPIMFTKWERRREKNG